MLLTQVGLLLNVLGTIALFFFGLPSPIIDVSNIDTLDTGTTPEAEKNKIRSKNALNKFASYVGLFLILIGFGFQLFGSKV